MNIYDISKKSGVSIATVSRCINNSGYVSEKTRARIMKVIEENNYMPNAFAKSIGGNSIKTIGILCTDPRDLYQASCIYHLEKHLRKDGYSSILVCTDHELAEKKEAVRQLYARSLDAMIFIGSQFTELEPENNQYILDASKQIPVVLINGSIDGENIYCIQHDDAQATCQLCDHMIQNGCIKPVYLARRQTVSSDRKVAGFMEACAKNGISNPEVYYVKDDLDEIFNCIEDLHLAGQGVDGYVCADDEIAVAAIKYVRAHDQKIPDDVQIAGFNNSVLAAASSPELSSFDNQLSYMCQSALFTLMGILDGRDFPNRTSYLGKPVFRQTTRQSDLVNKH